MGNMATIHISETEAARDFAGLLARVRAEADIVIENGKLPVAVLHAPAPPRRSIAECTPCCRKTPRRSSTRTSPATLRQQSRRTASL